MVTPFTRPACSQSVIGNGAEIFSGIMPEFDFKRFHLRSINAQSPEEVAAINQELKDLYATLSEDDKAVFNQQLQKFLSHEVGRLKSDYESVAGVNNPN